VYRWNIDSGRKLGSYKFPKKYRCDKAVVSPDGKVLVLVAYDALHKADKVQMIDVERDKVIKELVYDGTPARVSLVGTANLSLRGNIRMIRVANLFTTSMANCKRILGSRHLIRLKHRSSGKFQTLKAGLVRVVLPR